MNQSDEIIHVHKLDMRVIIEQFKRKGYELKEERKAEIAAQKGFRTLVFTPTQISKVE